MRLRSGSRNESGTVTTYLRFLTLEAIDLGTYRQSQGILPLWKTNITSTGSSGDLRLVFPVLVAAAANQLSMNTGHQVVIEIRESDPRVQRIKGLE